MNSHPSFLMALMRRYVAPWLARLIAIPALIFAALWSVATALWPVVSETLKIIVCLALVWLFGIFMFAFGG